MYVGKSELHKSKSLQSNLGEDVPMIVCQGFEFVELDRRVINQAML